MGVFVCEVAAMEVSQKKPAAGAPAAKRAENKKKALYVEKPFNKGTRIVSLKKRPNNYPVKSLLRKKSKVVKRVGAPKVRKSLTPGTVLILLAGVHRGKRVVFLKQLESGLLLVTGPYKVNGVPLRRCTQSAVIATSTKLDVSGVSIPDSINDAYFKRAAPAKKSEEGIFEKKDEKYTASEQRKADQKAVDAGLLAAVGSDPFMKGYLQKEFGLSRGQYPHLMKF